METILSVLVGVLFAAALYMMMRRSIVKLIIGLALLGYAANLLIFVIGGLNRAAPPIIPEGFDIPPEPVADPVPQALILTAIVITFGMNAFALVLVKRTYQTTGKEDLDAMKHVVEEVEE
jgi:multicomponent Na+:H+ antiporter subunit C